MTAEELSRLRGEADEAAEAYGDAWKAFEGARKGWYAKRDAYNSALDEYLAMPQESAAP